MLLHIEISSRVALINIEIFKLMKILMLNAVLLWIISNFMKRVTYWRYVLRRIWWVDRWKCGSFACGPLFLSLFCGQPESGITYDDDTIGCVRVYVQLTRKFGRALQSVTEDLLEWVGRSNSWNGAGIILWASRQIVCCGKSGKKRQRQFKVSEVQILMQLCKYWYFSNEVNHWRYSRQSRL